MPRPAGSGRKPGPQPPLGIRLHEHQVSTLRTYEAGGPFRDSGWDPHNQALRRRGLLDHGGTVGALGLVEWSITPRGREWLRFYDQAREQDRKHAWRAPPKPERAR